MAAKKKWRSLSRGKKCLIVAVGTVQIALQIASLRDLAQRTPQEVNGPKGAWVAASFINFAGPIAYFARGRKK